MSNSRSVVESLEARALLSANAITAGGLPTLTSNPPVILPISVVPVTNNGGTAAGDPTDDGGDDIEDTGDTGNVDDSGDGTDDDTGDTGDDNSDDDSSDNLGDDTGNSTDDSGDVEVTTAGGVPVINMGGILGAEHASSTAHARHVSHVRHQRHVHHLTAKPHAGKFSTKLAAARSSWFHS